MYTFDNVKTVCQQAFFNLRQDVTELTSENWSSANPPSEVAKCRLALETAVHEVIDDFRWHAAPTVDNISQWPSAIRNALVYCLARELAIPLAGRIEDMKVFDQLFRDKIQQAKIADFESGRAALTDEDVKAVFSLITVSPVHGDGQTPQSIKDVVDRVGALKEAARREVVSAHDWNFAKCVEPVESCVDEADPEYPFIVPYPRRALRMVTVKDVAGGVNEWKVEGGFVKARRPVSTIHYVRDVSDMGKWSASAKNAYIHRLAADVARTVMQNPQDAAMQEQAYVLALENAKLRDSRESNTPKDAWGENFYGDAMFRTTRTEIRRP